MISQKAVLVLQNLPVTQLNDSSRIRSHAWIMRNEYDGHAIHVPVLRADLYLRP